MKKYLQSYIHARDVLASGDYNASIANYSALLQQAPNDAETGKLTIFLASTYLDRNQEGDAAKAVALYKQVINNYKIPSYVRSLALNDVAVYVYGRGLSFYQLYFPETPYSTFIPADGSDTMKLKTIYLKLLQLSDQTYPNSFAEYAIAGNYYAYLIGNALIPTSEMVDAAQKAQSYITLGDSHNDQALYAPSVLAKAYFYRAIGLSTSAEVLGKPGTDAQEQAYQLAVQMASQYPTNPLVQTIEMQTRFYYAAFLMTTIGSSRDADIRVLLAPFGDATSTNPLLATGAYAQKQAPKLANISPAFAQFLAAQHWPPQQ
ncbi:MAG TPA: hypothetical protein VN495_03770 [Candidatus Paceibacterota bacterium]|nr:hypothetical protein [Candidatus Paceibacterota bacterium]